MATDDVPGFKPANNDKLAMGCWAEAADNAKDQSLIFVEAVEGGNVVFSVFDPETDVEYREAMAQKEFETFFSYDPKKANKDTPRWTWHDKTPFPWPRIMKDMKPGPRPSSFSSAAKKVAAALGWRAKQLDKSRGPRTIEGATVVRSLVDKIKGALDEHLDEIEKGE